MRFQIPMNLGPPTFRYDKQRRLMEDRRQAFQRNPELERFILPDVRPTGKQLGAGSYGSVVELKVNGLVCAGKRLHDALLDRDNAGVANIERRYLEECQVMAELRHPHIVQFLGLCFLQGSALPVLVMERLDSSLDELLEGAPSLPLPLKQSLLADVARGLLYLHTRNPPVVHRDLSARNVLLTSSLVAKISDLGNARIVNLQPGQLARTLSRLPGTMVYMPPEAFDEGSRYGPRLDIFSFGHLALFTLTQVFPGSLFPSTYPDPQNPDRLLARSEVERRRNYIQPLHGQLGEEHPLVQLVHQCLHNTPARRPSAEELLQLLEGMRAQIEGPYGQLVNVNLDMKKVRVLREKDTEIGRLQQQVQQLEAEMRTKDTQLQQKDNQIERQGTELQEKATEISRQQRELQILRRDKERLQAEVETKLGQILEKDAEISRQQGELQTLRRDKGRLQTEMEAKETQLQQKGDQMERQNVELQEKAALISRQQRELQTLREDRKRLQAEVEAKHTELQQKDTQIERQGAELQEKATQISRQQRELQTLREDRRRLKEEVKAQLVQAEEKDAEINRLRDQNTAKDERMAAVKSQLQQLQAVMDARSQVQQQLRERDAEINTLCRELRCEIVSDDESVAVVRGVPPESQVHKLLNSMSMEQKLPQTRHMTASVVSGKKQPKVCPFPGYEQKGASSIPLIVPDDFEYNAGSCELKKVDETLQRSKLVPHPEALKLLESIKKPLAVLTICGPARTGKSYMLSRILGCHGAFKLGQSVCPQTYGVWLGTHYLDFGDYAMILLDTEGTNAVGAENQDDLSVLLLATLLSSCLIYNSMNVPAESELQTMEWFTRLSSAIAMKQSGKGKAQELDLSHVRHVFPDFVWLLRDVCLQLPKNESGQLMTPRELILEYVYETNKEVGTALETFFATVDCKILPPPGVSVPVQEKSLSSQFIQDVQKFIAYIHEKAKPKRGLQKGQRVDGPILSMLVSSYLEAINDPSAKPCLENSWQSVVEVRCSQVIADLVKEYKTKMRQKLIGKLPMEIAISDETPNQPSLMQIHGDTLRKMLDKLREDTQYCMPADPAVSETERRKLSDRFTLEIIQTEQAKKGSKTTGKVVGGILHRFMEENEKMSREHCGKIFDEVSRSVYDCIKRAESDLVATESLKDIIQKEMEELQAEYSKKAIGPAKEEVLELKLKELEEYGSRIVRFQQKVREAIDREVLAEIRLIEKAMKAATDEQIKTHAKEREKMKQEFEDHMRRVKDDLERQLTAEKEKVKEFVGNGAGIQKDSIVELKQKLADADKQQQFEEERRLETEIKKFMLQPEKMQEPTKRRKINYTSDEKKKIAKVWLKSSPTKAKVRAECERLNLGAPFRADKKSEDEWISYFADKLLGKKLVTLKKTYDIQDSDIVVCRM